MNVRSVVWTSVAGSSLLWLLLARKVASLSRVLFFSGAHGPGRAASSVLAAFALLPLVLSCAALVGSASCCTMRRGVSPVVHRCAFLHPGQAFHGCPASPAAAASPTACSSSEACWEREAPTDSAGLHASRGGGCATTLVFQRSTFASSWLVASQYHGRSASPAAAALRRRRAPPWRRAPARARHASRRTSSCRPLDPTAGRLSYSAHIPAGLTRRGVVSCVAGCLDGADGLGFADDLAPIVHPRSVRSAAPPPRWSAQAYGAPAAAPGGRGGLAASGMAAMRGSGAQAPWWVGAHRQRRRQRRLRVCDVGRRRRAVGRGATAGPHSMVGRMVGGSRPAACARVPA